MSPAELFFYYENIYDDDNMIVQGYMYILDAYYYL